MLSKSIIPLDPDNKAHVHAAAHLHATLLPESPIACLGHSFMTLFYYSKLVKDGLVQGYLYSYQNKYVGFAVCTTKPFSFIQAGKKKHFIYLLMVLLLSFIKKPTRLFTMIKIAKGKQISTPKLIHAEKPIGQFLSFGVLSEYRQVKDEDSQQSVSVALMTTIVEYFRERGFASFFLHVVKQRLSAVDFYKAWNGHFEDNPYDHESYIVTFDLADQQVNAQ